MPWNKTDRSFKTLINKRVTDSDAKFYFNEKGDFTINTHQLELWVDAIPSTAPGATTDIVEYHNTLTLVEDTSVPTKQAWFATSNASTVPAQTDETSRLKNWVSDKYGSTYEIVLYDTSNVQIPPSDGCGWFFDYQTGILTFTSTTTTTGGGGSLSSRAPFKIKGYRYIGRTGLDGNIIKNEVRVATTPATSFSGWSYSSELIDTGVTSASLTIDGISLNTTEGLTGDRILIKNWSTLSNNGIYYVERAGDGASDTWRFRRAPDFNDTQDIFPGTMVFVRSGTVNARTVWSMSNASFTTLDAGGATGEITFAQFITATTRWSALTAPDANLSLAMSTYTTAFNWATGTSTNNLFSLTTDASSNGTGALLNLATGSSSTVLPLLVKAGATTALTVNASAQVLVGTLSSGRVTYAGTSGLLQDSANMTFNGSQLALAATGSGGGVLIGGDTQFYRDAADVIRTPDSLQVDTAAGIGTTAPATTAGRLYVSGSFTALSGSNYNIYSAITHTVNSPSTTTGRVCGLNFSVTAAGSGAYSDVNGPTGVEGLVTYSGSGTAAGAVGIIAYARNTGTGTLVRAVGLSIPSASNTGGGHISHVRSIDVYWSLVTTANNQVRCGIRINAGPTPAGHTGTVLAGIYFNSDSGTAVDGIVWGTTGDTNLYRSAANTLRTDDSFIVGTNLSVLNAGTFSLYESGSVNFSSFAAGTQANDLRYTLPTTQPSTNQVLTATAISGSGPYDITLGWVTNSASITIGDTVNSGTAGSLLFVGSGPVLAQDNANLYWDDTNNTLGIGTTRTGAISGTNPSVRILGTGTSSSTSSFEVQNSSAATLFFIRNDGYVGIGSNAPTSPLYVIYTHSADASLTLHNNILSVTSAQSGQNVRTVFNQMTLNTSGTITPSGSSVMPNMWNQLVVASTHTGAITVPTYGLNNEVQISQTGSTTHSLISGIRSFYNLNTGAGGTVTTADGLISTLQSGTAVTTTITTFTHYNTSYSLSGSPVIGTLTGIDIKDPGAGTVTTQYGIRVRDQSRGSTNYALYFDGTSGLARQGIWWNADTNLYRSAADTLKTDDSLVVGVNLSVLNAGTFSLYESGSVNFSSFAAGTQANDIRYTLPTTQPSTNQVLTATAVSGTGPYDITLGWVANSTDMAIGGAVTSGTTGSILFVGSGPVLAQDNSNLFWDDTNNYLGVGTSASPAARVHIAGNQSASAWGTSGILLRLGAVTLTDTTSSGTVTNIAVSSVSAPTIAASSVTTYTHAASFYITGNPIAGSNVTLTNSYALWVNNGASRFDDVVAIGIATTSARLAIGGTLSATAWGSNGISFRVVAATYTDTSSSGTVGTAASSTFNTPTFAASSVTTYTNAANVYISNAPTAGSNVTITNGYALWVNNGNVRIDDTLTLGGTTLAARLAVTGSISASAWGLQGIYTRVVGGTATDTSSSGTVTNVVMSSFGQNTIAASSVTTFTDSATVYISNAPAAGSNVTLTNAYALWVDNGTVRLDAGLQVRSLTSTRVTYAGTNGLLQDSANMTFDGNQLALATTGSSGGLLIGGDVQIYRSAANILRTPDSLTVDADLSIGAGTTFGTSTFVSNSARAYVDATNGFVLTGKTGSSYDFCMAAPGGSLLWTNPTGTANLSIVNGGLTTATYLDAGSYIDINGGVYASSEFRLYYNSTNGAQIASRAGSSTDFALYRANGTQALVIPTGTGTISAPNGRFSVGSTLYTTSGIVDFVGSTSGTVSVQVQAAAGTYNFNLPTTAGSSGDVLTSAGGAGSAMTWTAPGALAVRWNSIVAPTGNQSLAMSTNTTTFNWATGTSTNNLFNLTTDASANGTGALLRIATGASATVVPMLVVAAGTTALTVNASAQVLVNSLTSGRVTYAGTNGLLQDSANMTFDGNRISLATTGNTGGLLIGGDANLYRSAADVLRTDDSFIVGVNLSVLNAGTFSLYESGSVNFSSFAAGTQANDLRYTLPTSQPSTNQVLTATAVTGSGPYDITLGWVTNAASITIGDTVNSGTTGSILFVGSGPVLAQDNANFYWDDTNNTFGVGTTRSGAISGTNPTTRIKGSGTTSATSSFEIQDSSSNTLLFVRDDGKFLVGENTPVSATSVAEFHLDQNNDTCLSVHNATSGAASSASLRLVGSGSGYGHIKATSDVFNSPSQWAESLVIEAHTLQSGGLWLSAYTNTITLATTATNALDIQLDDLGKVGFGLAPSAHLHAGRNLELNAWGVAGIGFRFDAATYTDASSSGTVASVAAHGFAQPTFAATNVTTYTDAASLYISNAPATGANVTITNAYALWVDAGIVRLDGSVQVRSLTNGRVTYAGTNGLLQDSANMTFDGNRIALATTGNTGGLLIGGDANLYRSAADTLRTDDSFVVGANLSVLNAGTFSLYESGSVNFSSFVAGTQANDLRYTLPTTQPSTNQVLSASAVTGSGPYDITLGWATPATSGLTIGDSITGATAGSVLFAGTGPVLAQDNANLYFDDTNNTLGVGTTRSGAISGTNPRLRVKGSGATSATSSFEVQDSSAASLFLVRDDGLINLGSSGSFTNSTGQFALSTSGSSAGILLGGDANLYRSAANVLKTDDAFEALTFNKLTITAPASAATLTVADGATLTVSASATIQNGNHSNTNTGDETATTIHNKVGYTQSFLLMGA